MKALRRIAESKGYTTTGSDITLDGHNAENAEQADIAVYTTAVGEDNCEVLRARERGIPVYERAEFLGIVSREYKKVIAVAGTHGKTTATGFCARVFAPFRPTVHIGGAVIGGCEIVGGDGYFITEACEYKRNFLHLKPHIGVILNAELDHTDYYKDIEDYVSAFRSFADNCGTLVINGDDERCATVFHRNKITFGLGEHNFIRAKDICRTPRGRGFTVAVGGKELGRIELRTNCVHNVYSALAVFCVGYAERLSFDEIKSGLESFGGIARRFELLGSFGGCNLYSDYAHHPSEINGTVLSARENGCEKLTLVFQPHTYTRLKSLFDGFVNSLSEADRIIVAPVFAAREKPVYGISSHDLVRALINRGCKAVYIDSFFSIAEYLTETVRSGETVVFVGAGDIDKAAKIFASSLTD